MGVSKRNFSFDMVRVLAVGELITPASLGKSRATTGLLYARHVRQPLGFDLNRGLVRGTVSEKCLRRM